MKKFWLRIIRGTHKIVTEEIGKLDRTMEVDPECNSTWIQIATKLSKEQLEEIPCVENATVIRQ